MYTAKLYNHDDGVPGNLQIVVHPSYIEILSTDKAADRTVMRLSRDTLGDLVNWLNMHKNELGLIMEVTTEAEARFIAAVHQLLMDEAHGIMGTGTGKMEFRQTVRAVGVKAHPDVGVAVVPDSTGVDILIRGELEPTAAQRYLMPVGDGNHVDMTWNTSPDSPGMLGLRVHASLSLFKQHD